MKYTDIRGMLKRAYGGDMNGSGNSYYDRCYYYGWDPELEDIDEFLSSKQNVRKLRKDIKTYADLIRNPSKEFDIDGKPVTQVVLSRKAYNEEDNILGSEWADQVDEALKNNDDNRLADLSSYGYAWYGTKDATDNPLDVDMPGVAPKLPVLPMVLLGLALGGTVVGGSIGSRWLWDKYINKRAQ